MDVGVIVDGKENGSDGSGRNSWQVRYFRDDGTIGSKSGFRSEDEAKAEARRIDDIHHGSTSTDNPPAKSGAAPVVVNDWIDLWFDGIDVAPTTLAQYERLAQYESLTRNHIRPRWGSGHLVDIGNLAAHTWAAELRSGGLADSTVKTIMKPLAMILADAADENLLDHNPIRPRRRRRHHRTREIVWDQPHQALRVALQAASLVGPWAGVLDITAAWTGARWGELTGLRRGNLHLDDGRFVIDPDVGALHEIDRTLQLGPPKTAESARTVTLPPFLVELLRLHLDTHDHPHVFVTEHHALLRRSNFSRRAMRPAADGNLHSSSPRVRVHPVAPEIERRILDTLQQRWIDALAGLGATSQPDLLAALPSVSRPMTEGVAS
ncbi:tyrosine-type recombinase/integrase [Saccharothrix violaceirubra]|uniref:Integrase n=1 Tax=Saccharothrix violaceirubra TaxID=413306 RepID=A0A7W7T6M1_9PSEU|nr:site-specific integrase [Saccharothrix violaceirubra]MBB4967495.1 integrase [Saccharothrix violaceirubra]